MFNKNSLQYFIVALFLFATNCGSENTSPSEKSPDSIQEYHVDSVEVFTSFMEHDIARPHSPAILSSGNVALADYDTKRVSILSPAGEVITRFGNEGKGPGEFVQITDIQEIDGTLNIIDPRQLKVIRYDKNGNFRNSYDYKSSDLQGNISLKKDSVYFTGTGMGPDKLINRVNLRTDSTLAFGEPKGGEVEAVQMEKARSVIEKGEVPDFLKNFIKLGINDDYVYSFMVPYSELRKYSHQGNLIWDKPIPLPHNEAILQEVQEKVKNMASNTIPTIAYIMSMKVVEDQLYLLTNAPVEEPQYLIQLNEDGKISKKYTLPVKESKYDDFDINPETGLLYLVSPIDGFTFKVQLPG